MNPKLLEIWVKQRRLHRALNPLNILSKYSVFGVECLVFSVWCTVFCVQCSLFSLCSVQWVQYLVLSVKCLMCVVLTVHCSICAVLAHYSSSTE